MQKIEAIPLRAAQVGAHLGPHPGRRFGRAKIAHLRAERRFVAQRGRVGRGQSGRQCHERSGVRQQSVLLLYDIK